MIMQEVTTTFVATDMEVTISDPIQPEPVEDSTPVTIESIIQGIVTQKVEEGLDTIEALDADEVYDKAVEAFEDQDLTEYQYDVTDAVQSAVNDMLPFGVYDFSEFVTDDDLSSLRSEVEEAIENRDEASGDPDPRITELEEQVAGLKQQLAEVIETIQEFGSNL